MSRTTLHLTPTQAHTVAKKNPKHAHHFISPNERDLLTLLDKSAALEERREALKRLLRINWPDTSGWPEPKYWYLSSIGRKLDWLSQFPIPDLDAILTHLDKADAWSPQRIFYPDPERGGAPVKIGARPRSARTKAIAEVYAGGYTPVDGSWQQLRQWIAWQVRVGWEQQRKLQARGREQLLRELLPSISTDTPVAGTDGERMIGDYLATEPEDGLIPTLMSENGDRARWVSGSPSYVRPEITGVNEDGSTWHMGGSVGAWNTGEDSLRQPRLTDGVQHPVKITKTKTRRRKKAAHERER